jgi:hypothetical protein
MLHKTMEMYVLHVLVQCAITSIKFNLWMPKTKFDIFPLVINFINDQWVSRYVTTEVPWPFQHIFVE